MYYVILATENFDFKSYRVESKQGRFFVEEARYLFNEPFHWVKSAVVLHITGKEPEKGMKKYLKKCIAGMKRVLKLYKVRKSATIYTKSFVEYGDAFNYIIHEAFPLMTDGKDFLYY